MSDWSEEAEKKLDAWLGFRENVAAQLLFSDCLKKFESTSKKAAILNMFGGNVKITSTTTAKVKNIVEKDSEVSTQKKATQKTISSYLLDSYIVDNIKKKDKERVAATVAKKKTKDI